MKYIAFLSPNSFLKISTMFISMVVYMFLFLVIMIFLLGSYSKYKTGIESFQTVGMFYSVEFRKLLMSLYLILTVSLFSLTDNIMPASSIIHRIRTCLFCDMSQTIKNCHSLDFLTILMANLLVTYGTKA